MKENNFNFVLKTEKRSCPVQIIVLSYNQWGVTNDFLDLLFTNTPLELFHLIMIDNGSSDETPGMLKAKLGIYKNVTLLLHSENSGVIVGRNIGCSIALQQKSFDYLMFLDNDQFVTSGWLDHHIVVLNRGYDVVGVEAWQMNKSLLPSRKISTLHESFNYVGCGGMIIRKKVIDTIGILDERYNPAYFEDPDFNWRASDAGFKIGWNMKARIMHLGHQTLGVDQVEKQKLFFASWEKCRSKWSKRILPVFHQCFLEEFKGEKT